MDKLQQIQNLLIMAAADGHISDEEIHLLSEKCVLWGIESEDFENAVAYAISPEAELQLPTDDAQKREMLADLLRMMAADGELAETEKRLFAVAAASMEVGGDQLDELIDEILRDPGEAT